MDLDRWMEEAAARAALGSPADADRMLRATLATLGQCLVAEEADAVARELPAALAEVLRGARYERDFDPDELFERVARREATSLGFAREHALVVCQLVAESLRPEVIVRLGKHLGPAWAGLLAPRAPSRPPPGRTARSEPRSRPRDSLAEARPGSRRPLAEGRPEGAHTESVARSDDPHGDTKLSSARGLTQERDRESLAEGHPGPRRTLGDA